MYLDLESKPSQAKPSQVMNMAKLGIVGGVLVVSYTEKNVEFFSQHRPIDHVWHDSQNTMNSLFYLIAAIVKKGKSFFFFFAEKIQSESL